jgi:hypothetical protein
MIEKDTSVLFIALASVGVLIVLKNEVAHFWRDLKEWRKKRKEEK